MATMARRLTYDNLAAVVTEREGDRLELIDGVLYVTPAPRPVHQLVLENLYSLLERHVRAAGLGRVMTAPIDVRLSSFDVAQPDLLVIRRERLSMVGDVAIDGAPDLVVEILSPGTRDRDLGVKRDLYARSGVREYWLVDPAARTILLLTLRDGQYEAIAPDAAGTFHSALLPGLAVDPDVAFDLD